ncbi:hypothetical protein [Micromonospora sp. NPDC049102]|uniref:hypothetical protein n=1 Tax=Micromonospora sp. NPDC049102 TaxID=3364265 RepID=UPI00371CEC2C
MTHPGGGAAADNRCRIYRALLADPTRAWTVRELAAAVDTALDGTVRDTFNVLLADGILRQVPYRRSLTAVLTDHGYQPLTRLVRRAP